MVSAHDVARRFWSRLGRLSRADMVFGGVVVMVVAAEVVAWRQMQSPSASLATVSLGDLTSPIGVMSEDEASAFELEYGSLFDSRSDATPQTDLRREACSRPLGAAFYFPTGIFFRKTPSGWDADGADRRGFSKHLRAVAEPSLSCGKRPSRDYRFLWIGSFAEPVVIRATVPADRDQAASVLLDGVGYDAARLTQRRLSALTLVDQRRLMAAFSRCEFWNMPAPSDGPIPDGSTWVIEGRSGAVYHVVSRVSPRPGPFRDLGLLFMELAGLPTAGPSVD
jgi:hypothetical protein